MLIIAYFIINALASAFAAPLDAPAQPELPVVEAAITPILTSAPVPFIEAPTTVRNVPFYSQIRDISDPKWKKLSCGIADMAMIINFYKPGAVAPDALLQAGLAAGAFIDGVGWKHQGLADLGHPYGLSGSGHDVSHLSKSEAFAVLAQHLEDGPVIASVYYTFDPASPIPHLVVITGTADGMVFYNDPAMREGDHAISIAGFLRGWKKRFITIAPL